jgi:hypothetical protein
LFPFQSSVNEMSIAATSPPSHRVAKVPALDKLIRHTAALLHVSPTLLPADVHCVDVDATAVRVRCTVLVADAEARGLAPPLSMLLRWRFAGAGGADDATLCDPYLTAAERGAADERGAAWAHEHFVLAQRSGDGARVVADVAVGGLRPGTVHQLQVGCLDLHEHGAQFTTLTDVLTSHSVPPPPPPPIVLEARSDAVVVQVERAPLPQRRGVSPTRADGWAHGVSLLPPAHLQAALQVAVGVDGGDITALPPADPNTHDAPARSLPDGVTAVAWWSPMTLPAGDASAHAVVTVPGLPQHAALVVRCRLVSHDGVCGRWSDAVPFTTAYAAAPELLPVILQRSVDSLLVAAATAGVPGAAALACHCEHRLYVVTVPGVRSSGDDEAFEALHWRVARFYERWCPDKVTDADRVARRYVTCPAKLFAVLVARYGPEPEQERLACRPAADVSSAQAAAAERAIAAAVRADVEGRPAAASTASTAASSNVAWTMVPDDAGRFSCRVSHLLPSTSYALAVATVNPLGQRSAVRSFTIASTAALVPLGVVADVHAASTPTTVTVRWQPPAFEHSEADARRRGWHVEYTVWRSTAAAGDPAADAMACVTVCAPMTHARQLAADVAVLQPVTEYGFSVTCRLVLAGADSSFADVPRPTHVHAVATTGPTAPAAPDDCRVVPCHSRDAACDDPKLAVTVVAHGHPVLEIRVRVYFCRPVFDAAHGTRTADPVRCDDCATTVVHKVASTGDAEVHIGEALRLLAKALCGECAAAAAVLSGAAASPVWAPSGRADWLLGGTASPRRLAFAERAGNISSLEAPLPAPRGISVPCEVAVAACNALGWGPARPFPLTLGMQL